MSDTVENEKGAKAIDEDVFAPVRITAPAGFSGWWSKFGDLLPAVILVSLLVIGALSCIPGGNWVGFGICFGLAGFFAGAVGGGLLPKVRAAFGADKK